MDFLSFDAYFFDFDGLLADTEPLHYKAYQKLLERRNLHLPWDFTTYCSFAHQKTEVFAEVMFSLFPSLKEEEPNWMVLREEKQAIYQELLTSQAISLMPGADKLLRLLSSQSKSLYVVTNATLRQITAIRKLQPLLNLIPTWITREDYKHPKPAPDCYLKALEIHGDPSCKVVGLEDTLRGVTALQAAHITSILILPHSYPKPHDNHLNNVLVFHSLEELLPNSQL